jgi:hypothetical protein
VLTLHRHLAAPYADAEKLVPRLQQATGLQVTYYSAQNHHNAEGHGMFYFQAPTDKDRNKFVDAFVDTRNKAGISREEMPIQDSMKSQIQTDFENFDESHNGFYVPNMGTLTPNVLSRIDSNAEAFKAIAVSTPAKPTEPSRTPVPSPTDGVKEKSADEKCALFGRLGVQMPSCPKP